MYLKPLHFQLDLNRCYVISVYILYTCYLLYHAMMSYKFLYTDHKHMCLGCLNLTSFRNVFLASSSSHVISSFITICSPDFMCFTFNISQNISESTSRCTPNEFIDRKAHQFSACVNLVQTVQP